MGAASPGKLGYLSLTLRNWATCHELLQLVEPGENLTLGGQTGAVILCGLVLQAILLTSPI
jgi:hypothetical protein